MNNFEETIKNINDVFNNNYIYKDIKKNIPFKNKENKFSINNNGIFSYKKGCFSNVVLVEFPSLDGFIAYKKGTLSIKMIDKYLEKNKVDTTLKNNKSIKNKQELIDLSNILKEQISIFSTYDKSINKKENRKKRNEIIEGLTQFIFLMIFDYFDFERIVKVKKDHFFYVLKDNETKDDIEDLLNSIFNIDSFDYDLDKEEIFFNVDYFDFIEIKDDFNYISYNYENNNIKFDFNFLNENNFILRNKLESQLKNQIKKGGIDMKNFLNNKDIEKMILESDFDFSGKLNKNVLINNPRFILIENIEKYNNNDNEFINYLIENKNNIFCDFPFTLEDKSNLNEKEITYETSSFGNVTLLITSDRNKIKDRENIENLDLFLLENTDLRLFKKKIMNLYNSINDDFFDNTNDEKKKKAIIRMNILYHMIVLSLKKKKKNSDEINDFIYEISNFSKGKMTLNQFNNLSNNEIYDFLDKDKNWCSINNKFYFKNDNIWSDSDMFFADWLINCFDLEYNSKKVIKDKIDKFKKTTFICLQDYLKKNKNSDKEKKETCWQFADGTKMKFDENGDFVQTISKDDIAIKILPFTIDEMKNWNTEENKEKALALVNHLVGYNEEQKDIFLNAISNIINYHYDFRKNLNIGIIFSGVPHSGKTTFFNDLLNNAIGDDYFYTDEKINIDENKLHNAINKNCVLIDDAAEFIENNGRLTGKNYASFSYFVDGKKRTIKKLYDDKINHALLSTPIILCNKIPTITADASWRRILFFNIEQTIFSDKKFVNSVSDEEIKSRPVACGFLCLLLENLQSIYKDIYVNKKVKNNRRDILKTYLNIDSEKTGLNIEHVAKNNLSEEVNLILETAGLNQVEDLVGLRFKTIYDYYKKVCFGTLNQKLLKQEFAMMGFSFDRIYIQKSHIRGILQKNNDDSFNKKRKTSLCNVIPGYADSNPSNIDLIIDVPTISKYNDLIKQQEKTNNDDNKDDSKEEDL